MYNTKANESAIEQRTQVCPTKCTLCIQYCAIRKCVAVSPVFSDCPSQTKRRNFPIVSNQKLERLSCFKEERSIRGSVNNSCKVVAVRMSNFVEYA